MGDMERDSISYEAEVDPSMTRFATRPDGALRTPSAQSQRGQMIRLDEVLDRGRLDVRPVHRAAGRHGPQALDGLLGRPVRIVRAEDELVDHAPLLRTHERLEAVLRTRPGRRDI